MTMIKTNSNKQFRINKSNKSYLAKKTFIFNMVKSSINVL